MIHARHLRRLAHVAVGAVFALGLAGCAMTPADPAARQAMEEANDPLEVPNRMIFAFNEAVDVLAFRPAAEVYVATVPDPIRDSIQNFVRNLLSPLVIAHNLLQGDFEGAQIQAGRFLTNTVLGAGGIADVATVAGLPHESEDAGQTFGVWGIGEGPYLVLPILGPSNLRDAVGTAADFAVEPVGIGIKQLGTKLTLSRTRAGLTAVDTRSRFLAPMDDIKRNSLDHYATMRSLYRQSRQADISDSKGGAMPSFPDDPVAQ